MKIKLENAYIYSVKVINSPKWGWVGKQANKKPVDISVCIPSNINIAGGDRETKVIWN